MNKKYIYIGLGILAVGGIAYFLFKSKKSTTSENDAVLESSKLEPQTNVKMPKKKLKPIGGASGGIESGSASIQESTSKKTRRPFLGEKITQGVDPRIDEAMKNRDEANRIRLSKGITDARWWGEMMGQKLTSRQQMFMKYKQSSATSDEMLSASTTMLNWAKNR
jgi:hypothetical protein